MTVKWESWNGKAESHTVYQGFKENFVQRDISIIGSLVFFLHNLGLTIGKTEIKLDWLKMIEPCKLKAGSKTESRVRGSWLSYWV